MPLRVLVYMTRIWRSLRQSQERRGPLPVILPVVLHHGERGWTAPRALRELLDGDDAVRESLAHHVPDFELLVDDLALVPEAELLAREGAPLGKLVVWVLRAVRVGFDPALVERWAEQLNRAESGGSREALLHVLQYLLGTDEGSTVFEALDAAPLSDEVREVVMGSYQQKWIEQGQLQGRAEGRAEGKAEGKAELLLKLLRLRFQELPPHVEPRVRGASDAELDRWAERVLSADTLDEALS